MTIIENLEDRSRLLESVNVRGKTLLDIGVGPLASIAVRDFGCHVTSIDTSDTALQRAAQAAAQENIDIVFRREDATNLSYEDNTFDVAISYGTLHHVPSTEGRHRFLIELHRVVTEKVVIADFNTAGFPHSPDEYEMVDFSWLEQELSTLGKTKKLEGRRMNAYICRKE